MKRQKVHVEEFDEALFDWVANAHIPGPDGKILKLGTVIRVNNQLIAISPLTTEQLDKLEDILTQALAHERAIRNETKLDPNLTE